MTSHVAASQPRVFIEGYSLFNKHKLCDSTVSVVLDQTREFDERAHAMLRSRADSYTYCDDDQHRRRRSRIEPQQRRRRPKASSMSTIPLRSVGLATEFAPTERFHKRRSPSIATVSPTASPPSTSECEIAQLSDFTDCDILLSFLALPTACDDAGDTGFSWGMCTA